MYAERAVFEYLLNGYYSGGYLIEFHQFGDEANVGAKIRLATTDADRNAVFRFRYEIYVKEMKRFQKCADHEKCRIEEPFDKTGHILIAEDSDRVVGTARFNVGTGDNFGLYEDLYRLRRFDSFYPSAVSITTKLMVARDYRCSRLALQLAVHCYLKGASLGVLFDCIDCNEPLAPFFRKLGYRQVGPEIVHPEYGCVVPMILATLDCDHLAKVGSPFAKYARKIGDARDSVAFFRRKFFAEYTETSGTSFHVFAEHDSGRNHDSIIA